MFDTLNQVNWLKVGLILAALLLAGFAALYIFNVPFSTLVWIALIGGFAWMHMGMHGGHGGHGGHNTRDNANGDEHAGHTTQATNGAAKLDTAADPARTISADANARGLTSKQPAAQQEQAHRHHGC